MRTGLVLAGLVLSLGLTAALVAHKERVVATGTPVLLELAPVDPRSLIQGDYMRLDYALARGLWDDATDDDWPRTGQIVVTRDTAGVARFVRRHEDDVPLGAGELLLTYRRGRGGVRIGTDAFHFQEGDAARYERARYGELRVAGSGTSVLVGLRDSAGRVLGRAVERLPRATRAPPRSPSPGRGAPYGVAPRSISTRQPNSSTSFSLHPVFTNAMRPSRSRNQVVGNVCIAAAVR